MQNCDEVILEVSRAQASFSDGNASWGIQIPPLIIEEGDQIQALGAWLSVKNSGDNAIELFDEQNPNDKKIAASFDVSLWKTMDGINVVAFPYHSMKWSNERNNLGAGFSVPAYTQQTNPGTAASDEPTFTFTQGSTQQNNVPVSQVNTYDSLLNYKDADKYHFHFDLLDEYGTKGYATYLDFMINNAASPLTASTQHPQGIIDEANTGNRYYVMWRQRDGTYIRHKKRVDLNFPIGYYTPSNIASFITDQMNLVYYNSTPQDSTLPEAWTPAFRYFEAMYPVPIPQVNLTMGLGQNTMLDTMNSALFEPNGTSNTTQKQTGFYRRFTDNQSKVISVTGTIPAQTLTISFHNYRTDTLEYDNLLYLSKCLDNYSGTQGGFVGSWAERNHSHYAFRFNPLIYIESITQSGQQVSGIFGSAESTHTQPGMSYNSTSGVWEMVINVITQTSSATLTSAFEDATNFVINIYWGFEMPPDTFGGAHNGTKDKQHMWEWISPTYGGAGATPQIATCLPPTMPMFCGRIPLNSSVLGLNATSPTSPYTFAPVAMSNANTYAFPSNNPMNPVTSHWKTCSNTLSINPTSTPTQPTQTKSQGYTLDYTNGNSALGGTYGNFHRWSLRNWEEPPFVPYNSRQPDEQETADYPQLMPILRKYPLFTEFGMKLNTSLPDASGVNRQIYMYPISTASTVTMSPIDQSSNYLIEDKANTLNEVQFRCKLWADFIQAQIDDGLTRSNITNDLPNNKTDFLYFVHLVIETSQATADPFEQYTQGTDVMLRNRARGFVCRINRDKFNAASVLDDFDESTQTGTYYGVKYRRIGASYYVQLDAQSWIYDGIGGGNNNYGFNDYNNADADTSDVLDLTVTITNATSLAAYSRTGVGFCYKKTSWRNFTAMLCAYQEKSQNPEYVFDPRVNRMPTQQASWGQITYQTRVGIGAKNPSLVFDADGSSRFYFQQFYQPQTVMNRWFDGIQNTDNPQLISSINFPIFTWTYQKGSKTSKNNTIPDFATGFSITTTQAGADASGNYSNDFEPNSQVSDDCVYYNQSKWFLENEAFFQFALEMPKLISFDWRIQTTTTGGATVPSNNGKGAWYGDWNTPTGNSSFYYQYCVDTDYESRFFCFNQNARYNSWAATFKGSGLGQAFYKDDTDNNGISDIEATLGFKGITPVAFWGCASGEEMITKWNGQVIIADRNNLNVKPNYGEPSSSNGTCDPNPMSIYAERSGISIDTFYTRAGALIEQSTFTNSFWSIVGFALNDLLPLPYQYCNQTRNLTVNFLTTQDNSDDVNIQNVTSYRSRPITTQASIPSNFNIVQANRVNTIQDTTQYPSLTYVSKIGITAINRNEQVVSVVVGGPSTTPQTGSGLTNVNLAAVSTILGGVSFINQQLLNNQFYILLEQSDTEAFGTKIYSDGLAQKIDDAFYLVRSDLPEDNFKYINNAANSSTLPVVAVANKQYGATTDYYYSDAEYMTFVNKRRRVISSVSVTITDSAGNLATVLQPKSTIFFRIIRNADGVKPLDTDILEDQARFEAELNKKQRELLNAEIKALISPF